MNFYIWRQFSFFLGERLTWRSQHEKFIMTGIVKILSWENLSLFLWLTTTKSYQLIFLFSVSTKTLLQVLTYLSGRYGDRQWDASFRSSCEGLHDWRQWEFFVAASWRGEHSWNLASFLAMRHRSSPWINGNIVHRYSHCRGTSDQDFFRHWNHLYVWITLNKDSRMCSAWKYFQSLWFITYDKGIQNV